MFRDRLDQLQSDLRAVRALVDVLEPRHTRLAAAFKLQLEALQGEIDAQLATAQHRPSSQRWASFTTVDRRCRETFNAQLELVGGAAIASGFGATPAPLDQGHARRAAWWLEGLQQRLRLDHELIVVSGGDGLIDGTTGIVRVPFLDWNLWRLPLLARALGLWAAPDLAQHVRMPPAVNRPSERELLADMFATALVGPAYALAVFVLELDYWTSYASGPSPAERAAVILGTLSAMDLSLRPLRRLPGPYTLAVERLEAIWRAMATLVDIDPLDSTRQQLQAWCNAVYDHVLADRLSSHLAQTQARWKLACEWQRQGAWDLPPQLGPGDPERLTLVLSALWLNRGSYADRGEDLLATAEAVLAGNRRMTGAPSRPPDEAARLVLRVRVDEFARRRLHLEALLASDQVPPESRSGVAGRFSRLFSQLAYDLDTLNEHITLGKIPRRGANNQRFWETLESTTRTASSVQQEALDFFGGALIRSLAAARVPDAAAAQHASAAPAACDVADALLDELAQRTGVSWRARTVLGREWFTDMRTDVVRVRFPESSAWRLPLLAHEFGHLVFRVNWNAELAKYLSTQSNLVAADNVGLMVEEVYADVYATYALGPGFACAAILSYFDPLEAHWLRGVHPTYDERTRIILDTLRAQGKRVGRFTETGKTYRTLVAQLEQSWNSAVAAAKQPDAVVSAGPAAAHVRRWASDLYPMIDRSYRFGSCYGDREWARALGLARQLHAVNLSDADLRHWLNDTGCLLADVLTASWWARLQADQHGTTANGLEHAIARLCRYFVGATVR